ncbi:HAD-IIB family hydrolase [Candidatus Parcubacteria bacterium]|nr:MAG: HAD-IIB family hydrolase [Candidatus Parcubacteria bacterium]
MTHPQAVLFDLDDTLAESFQPPTQEMIERLHRLLEKVPVAILSAAGLPRIQHDFLEHLADSPSIDRFFVFSNSASECFQYKDGVWQLQYHTAFTPEERTHIKATIETCAAEVGYRHPEYEPQMWDRESQIAYAMINSHAPQTIKKSWDPDQAKRKQIKACLDKVLTDCQVLIGGNVTIDITKKGVDKSHGVKWLSEKLGIEPGEMLYIGDALYPGGNDSVVIPTGIQTRETSGPEETMTIVDEILKSID